MIYPCGQGYIYIYVCMYIYIYIYIYIYFLGELYYFSMAAVDGLFNFMDDPNEPLLVTTWTNHIVVHMSHHPLTLIFY